MTTTAIDSAIASRFTTFRNNYIKLGQTELAKEAGITQKTISFIETGRAVPNQKTLTYLSRKYKLNAEWLMTGKGEPISNAKAEPNSIANMQARIAMLEKQVQTLQETIKTVLEKLA